MKTRIRTTRPTVTTAAARLLTRNPARVAIIFSNLGANNVSLDTLDTVTTALGVQLDSSGGLVNIKKSDEGSLPTDEWYGIAGANQQIVIKEVIRTSKVDE